MFPNSQWYSQACVNGEKGRQWRILAFVWFRHVPCVNGGSTPWGLRAVKNKGPKNKEGNSRDPDLQEIAGGSAGKHTQRCWDVLRSWNVGCHPLTFKCSKRRTLPQLSFKYPQQSGGKSTTAGWVLTAEQPCCRKTPLSNPEIKVCEKKRQFHFFI